MSIKFGCGDCSEDEGEHLRVIGEKRSRRNWSEIGIKTFDSLTVLEGGGALIIKTWLDGMDFGHMQSGGWYTGYRIGGAGAGVSDEARRVNLPGNTTRA